MMITGIPKTPKPPSMCPWVVQIILGGFKDLFGSLPDHSEHVSCVFQRYGIVDWSFFFQRGNWRKIIDNPMFVAVMSVGI